MTEQKPMSTTDRQPAKSADDVAKDRQRRQEEVGSKMTDHGLAERVRAAHPHMYESDDGLKAASEDYDRLKGEQDKAKSGSAGQEQRPA